MKARFNEIQDTDQLTTLIEKSNEEAVVLFKHSTTCPISAGVYHEISNADVDINLIVVQRSRNVSTELAERTGVKHESPQAIVLKNGRVVYHASHYDVTAQEVEASAKF
jgi:bacillithiol system protein YtxJ